MSQLLNYDSAVRCCPHSFHYLLPQTGNCYSWDPRAQMELDGCQHTLPVPQGRNILHLSISHGDFHSPTLQPLWPLEHCHLWKRQWRRSACLVLCQSSTALEPSALDSGSQSQIGGGGVTEHGNCQSIGSNKGVLKVQ